MLMATTPEEKKIEPFCRLAKSMAGHRMQGIHIFNRLPQRIAALPYDEFKLKTHQWLVNTPFYSLDEFNAVDMNDVFN